MRGAAQRAEELGYALVPPATGDGKYLRLILESPKGKPVTLYLEGSRVNAGACSKSVSVPPTDGIDLITPAAGPTTTLRGGMLLVTTAPAPMMLSSPMRTPLRMIALLPIHTRSPIWTGFAMS